MPGNNRRDPPAPYESSTPSIYMGPEVRAWANRITDEYEHVHTLWGKSVEATVRLGRLLIKAKKRLGRGDWGRMFRGHPYAVDPPLPFSQDTAEMLMAIAQHPVLSKSENSRNLPPAWTTLYALSRLDEPGLQQAIGDRLVHAGMKGDDAQQLINHTRAGAGRDTDPVPLDTAALQLPRIVDEFIRTCQLGDEARIEDNLVALAARCAGNRDKRSKLLQTVVEKLYERRFVLKNATPGRRVRIGRERWIREPSTFPPGGWTRRRADRDDEALGHVIDGKICGKREQEILEWAYQESMARSADVETEASHHLAADAATWQIVAD